MQLKEFIDVKVLMKQVKGVYQIQLEKDCEDDDVANDMLEDRNNIVTIVIIKYLMKTVRLFIILVFISYYVGIFAYIIFDFTDPSEEMFTEAYDMFGRSKGEKIVLMQYFAFTSLSTVGFGDIHPKSNIERGATSVILLMGVAIFSYIMGMFTEILNTFLSLNASLSDDENLAKFFGLIQRFNKNKSLNSELKK